VEDQAIDRVHRLGQKHRVKVPTIFVLFIICRLKYLNLCLLLTLALILDNISCAYYKRR
jgi:hypothetical protein